MPQSLTYIFDLDRTLYPLDHPLFERIFHSIEQAIADRTGLTQEGVRAQMHVYNTVHKDPFNTFAADYGFPLNDVLVYPRHLNYGLLMPCAETRRLLHNLPAHKKIVYTDSVAEHAELVLNQLHLRDLFDAVYDLQFSNYKAKCRRDNFDHVLADINVSPAECVMIEDSTENLKIAKNMGIRTVLLTDKLDEDDDFVDERASNLPTWLRQETEKR